MLKIAVLGSTQGTDLQTILDAISDSRLTGVNIEFVLSNEEQIDLMVAAAKKRASDFSEAKCVQRLVDLLKET